MPQDEAKNHAVVTCLPTMASPHVDLTPKGGPTMNRRTLTLTIAATALVAAFALPIIAQETDHSGHMMSGMESPATMAFMEANMKMHGSMEIEYTGNPDVDFLRGMIPHHQGAVDMAKIVLEHGTDPEVKAFAETIIAAQEAEIKWMQDWLAKNGG
jgi:uncharacterized protein (DUF305 family)